MSIKRILLALVILAVLGGAYGLYLFYKPVPDTVQMKTDSVLTGMELALAFESDEAAAGKAYRGKVLEVTGIVTEVLPGDPMTLVLGTDGSLQVLAGMDEVKGSKNSLIGEEVTVKGICTGATMLDVVLSRCILLNK